VRSYYFGVLYLNGDVTAPNARMIVNGGEGLKAQNKYIRKWFWNVSEESYSLLFVVRRRFYCFGSCC
jgi:hypothetical protein